LAENGIPSMVYYPIELHKQKAFEVYNKSGENFPVSAQLCQTVLSLPMHTELSKETVSFIASHVMSSIDSLSV
jgi:dTDP-4-amino-4,6-dideoxygalactose transaminase